ncbi:hypothetical protein PFISCL1PPCAC_7584, partial [Pristionchus fissidentatus]
MTAAAMVVSYTGSGVQLFLSTANIPVFNLAYALDALDYGDKEIVHLISSVMEESGKHTPFAIFRPATDPIVAADRIMATEDELALLRRSGGSKCHRRRLEMRLIRERAWNATPPLRIEYDIILGTVDMILARLMKKKNPKNPCPIQELLETFVQRIVVDEASQLTEAALNALMLCFPHAQIVLIGDTKQLPPFKYVQDDIVSELSAHPALEVLKRKRNVPIIKLLTVYRAAPSVMAHYSNVFYEGKLVSGKPESKKNLLSCLINVIEKPCIFVDVLGESKLSGTSQYNDEEINALEFLVKKLCAAGHDHNHVMVIAYYEAQRKKAAARLPKGYEVLTVDSSQGREKEIVIVLTTRSSITDSGFFTCPLRANVATSRQKEAIFVLGHYTLLAAEPWHKLLSKE